MHSFIYDNYFDYRHKMNKLRHIEENLRYNEMFKKLQEYFTNSKETLHTQHRKGYEFGNDSSFSNEKRETARDYPTELKFAFLAFCVSFIIVCSKLVIVNSKYKFYILISV
jgi:hypothetical protein